MPRFFFHVRRTDDYVEDWEGSVLPDLDAARREANENAREAMSRAVLIGLDLSESAASEIHDEQGQLLLVIPYGEAIRKP